ncbi:S8 family serine peptidase [Sungkyunkwania multivorans]|uniref:S8 family serine peptidase n=1 Tax=Sungkyunkwania multivorans TaxID=1173618 RepID=A0ABW3CVS0_9FLAO
MMKHVLYLLLLFTFTTIAQEHALVYFTDKPNVADALANPNTILTQEAIDRKALHGVPIDERDVPMNNTYVANIAALPNIELKARLRWFNAVHVIGTQAAIDALASLGYVDSVYYFDRSLNPSSRSVISEFQDLHLRKLETSVIYNYGNTNTQITMINVHKLHEADYTANGMVIAVLDSGFPNVDTMGAFQQMRDNGNYLGGYDYVNRTPNIFAYTGNNHGTLVLSDMAGFIQDQFVGTAPDAAYYLFRTEDAGSETPVEESYWVEAAARADSLGVDVINTSLGYSTFDEAKYNYTTADMDGNTAIITKGANVAIEKGVLVVNSAGNSGGSPWGIITAPADGNVFTVGAVDAAGNYASFSSRGPTADGRVKPDVMAMGASAAIIDQNNIITSANGTSFSSPIMAGAVACLWQADPGKTNLEIMQLLREQSSMFGSPTDQMGYGIPNLELAMNVLGVASVPFQKLSITPNPVANKFQVLLGTVASSARIQIYSVLGKQLVDRMVTTSDNTIDIATFTKGMYLAKITTAKKEQTFKLIKQ